MVLHFSLKLTSSCYCKKTFMMRWRYVSKLFYLLISILKLKFHRSCFTPPFTRSYQKQQLASVQGGLKGIFFHPRDAKAPPANELCPNADGDLEVLAQLLSLAIIIRIII